MRNSATSTAFGAKALVFLLAIVSCYVVAPGQQSFVLQDFSRSRGAAPASGWSCVAPVALPFVETFDTFGAVDGSTVVPLGWVNDPFDNGGGFAADWRAENAGTSSSGTGPSADHTTGVPGQGFYYYVEDSGAEHAQVNLCTPCIDLSGTTTPRLSFWLHSLNGGSLSAENEISVDVVTPTMTSTDVFGPQGDLASPSWSQVTVDLAAFSGQQVEIRFRGNSDNGDFRHDVAIDDVMVFDATPDVIEQPPVCNCPGPRCPEQVLGVASGCGGTAQGMDVEHRPNRVGASTILPHSGQETFDQADLLIRGRDRSTDLRIMRRHLTRVNQSTSPFGPAFAFNYRHHFIQRSDGDIDMSCFGRVDPFLQASSTEWTGGPGRFERLGFDGATTTTLRTSGGVQLRFHTEVSMGRLVGHLTAIVSPNGNSIGFTYETAAQQPDLVQRKLLNITESFGRLIDFLYQDVANPDLVTTIRDFSGREVVYTYNPQGQLTSVRSPTVTTTAGFNDFPAGKTTLYGYLNHADPRLTNALTQVVAPNEQAAGVEPRYTWTYDTSLVSPFFGYVTSHVVGNPGAPGDLAAGGTYTYSYQAVAGAGGPNDAARRTTIVDRRGTVTVMELNRLGHVLREEVFTQGLRSPEPPSRVRTFQYTDDGDMTQSIDVLGTTSSRAHSDPATHPRTSQANETLQQDPADARGGDQVTIQSQTVYEPVFNRPFQVTDPRGFEAGNTLAQFTTTFFLDYMEDLPAATAHFAPILGVTPAELGALFTAAGITSQGDLNGDGDTSQRCGNIVRIEHPDVSLPPQSSVLGLTSPQHADETFQYNAFGQVAFHRDAEENVTTYEYFGADDPDGNGTIDVIGANPTMGGYLRRTVRDAQSGAGRNSGQDPTPVAKTTELEYAAQSGAGFPENLRGVPTAMIDPRGIKHAYLVNELDQVVKIVRAADVSASPRTGLVAFGYERHALYDANDNVIAVRIQNRDTLDGANDLIEHTYTYDILDQRRAETMDVGGLDIVNRLEYDASQNLTSITRGVGKPEASTDAMVYDERDILVTRTRGFGSPDAATSMTRIDDNGNVVELVDAEGSDVTQYERDGFDRLKKVIDRNGNEEILTYDSSSNVVSVERRGPVDETSASPILLARTDSRYDERNRVFQTDAHVFHYAGKAIGAIDGGAGSAGAGLVTSVSLYDRAGRVVGLVDADGDTSENLYDGVSRVIRRVDALANEVVKDYDPNDNLISKQEIEKSPLVAQDEVFVTQYAYDSLDRRIRVVEPNGQETLIEYDSRDNLVRTRDALGNAVDRRHDRVDRLIDVRTWLSATGTQASSSNADPAQGGGDGVITLLTSFDDLSRATSRTDDTGNVTAYAYDDLDRKTRCDYADGTFDTWTYNGDDELLTHTDQNGSVETWLHDPGSRPTQVAVVPGPNVIGTTLLTTGYDGLDRTTRMEDDNGTGEDVVCEYLYDSLSRQIRERQTVGSRPTLDVDSEWQGDRRRVSVTYPDARIVRRTYDALDRLSTIVEGLSVISLFDYVGPSRDLRVRHGNLSVLDKRNAALTQTYVGPGAGYDANRRSVRHEWRTSGGATITAYVNTYNGPGGLGTNRRAAEFREHLGHRDDYTFDSSYRMVGFLETARVPRYGLNGAGAIPTPLRSVQSSIRGLDGTDKMLAFVENGADAMPVIDGVPAEAGMNQYSSFGGAARSYDAASNLTDDARFLYRYDYADRLVDVRDAGTNALVARYTYAADRRRVLREVGAETTRYLFRGWQVCEERDDLDRVLRQYVDGRTLDEHCQLKDHSQPSAPEYYYHGNSQGFVGALTDANEDVVELYEYSWLGRPRVLAPDGVTRLEASTVSNPYLFQGRRLDPESGLYHFRNRYYDPRTGEFLSQDPLGNWNHGQGNGFSAFGEDGWNKEDPLGLGLQDDLTEAEIGTHGKAAGAVQGRFDREAEKQIALAKAEAAKSKASKKPVKEKLKDTAVGVTNSLAQEATKDVAKSGKKMISPKNLLKGAKSVLGKGASATPLSSIGGQIISKEGAEAMDGAIKAAKGMKYRNKILRKTTGKTLYKCPKKGRLAELLEWLGF